MLQKITHQTHSIPQVMVSSTFTDLQEHRSALIDAIHSHKLHANVMENDSARLVDVIDSSLNMVRDSAAYIGIISLKYGQVPECPRRNPDKLSITELEFNEAQRLKHPILLFIMGEGHPVKKADIEKDPEKESKLNAFRERAKKMASDSNVHRVYAEFNSPAEFNQKINSSISELRNSLDSKPSSVTPSLSESTPILQEGIEWMHDYVNRALKILLSNTPIPSQKQCKIVASPDSLSMSFGNTELIVRFGRIEDCEDKMKGYVVALPSTEFFDDDCATDPSSALGAYFGTAFPRRIKKIQSIVAEKLKSEPSVLVERADDEMHRSYGVAKCIYLENLLNSRRRVILVAVTTQRAKVGIRCEPYYLFSAMKALFQTMNSKRLLKLGLPAMGSGHGGVEPELALLYLILSLKAVIDRHHAGNVQSITIVVFQKNKEAKPSIARDVVSRIMSIARVVP